MSSEEFEPGSPASPRPAAVAKSAERERPPSPYAPFWLYGVPILCLIAMLLFWNQTQRDIATLAENQRQLAADLDAARGLTTISVKGAPALGPADQVVTLVEFSDYECPFCIRHFTQTMDEIRTRLIDTGQIRYVFKDFPIDQLHPGAIRAHEASRCAAEQGKFWEMHARMFSAPGTHSDVGLEAHAAQAGLSAPAFAECLASGRTKADIASSISLAADLGATGTPSFFIGLRNPETDDVKIVSAVTGAQPFAAFEKAIASVAARVPKS
jgi:protein-disulfide isomerase